MVPHSTCVTHDIIPQCCNGSGKTSISGLDMMYVAYDLQTLCSVMHTVLLAAKSLSHVFLL